MNQQKQNVAKSMKKVETSVASVIVPIVQEKYAYVFELFYRRTSDRDVAADLTQTVFAKLTHSFQKLKRSRKKLPPPEAINSFIDTVAHNCLCDYFKKLGYSRAALAAARASKIFEFGITEFAATELDPAKLAEKAETSARLNVIFLGLPAGCFECVCMRYLGGLEYKEIAKKLGISVNSVGTYLTRARVALRENPFVRSLLEND